MPDFVARRGFTDMGWEIVPEVFAQHLVRLAPLDPPDPLESQASQDSQALQEPVIVRTKPREACDLP